MVIAWGPVSGNPVGAIRMGFYHAGAKACGNDEGDEY